MRNRIVDSTWLGRGRHVLLAKCLRAQATSKTRSRVLPPLRPRLSRLFERSTRSHTSSLSLANVFACSLARSLACSFTYPHTGLFLHSLPHSIARSAPLPSFHRSSRSASLAGPTVRLSPISYTPPWASTPSPSDRRSRSHSFFRRAPSRGPTWPPPSQRNCMSKCQRHSVQLLTARTVNDRSPSSTVVAVHVVE